MSHIKFKKNGLTKEVKVGFSWTTFFFTFWVPMLRGMWAQAVVCFLTFGFAALYYMFTINKIYARKLVEDGWCVIDSDRAEAYYTWGIE